MHKVFGPADTREYLVDHLEDIEAQPNFGEPTPEEVADYATNVDRVKDITHKTTRGKREIAMELNMTVGQLEAILIGRSVLDIGCGMGVLSQDIARLKRTNVTALDYDPEILARVPASKNLTPVEGSGYDLQAVLGDEQFDVVISAYSSLLWAKNPDEKRRAISSAVKATSLGGKTIFIPVIQHVESRALDRRALLLGRVRGFSGVSEADLQMMKNATRVADWHDSVVLRQLLGLEDSGIATCTFVSSRENALGKPIGFHKGPQDPKQESYSVILDINSK